MTEDECLQTFGLRPGPSQLPRIRELLEEQAKAERRSQGQGDTELMKLLCVQLFNSALAEDTLLLWRAKTSSMDADASIDVQLLCGAGFSATEAYLATQESAEALHALERLRSCKQAGDFEGFTPERLQRDYEDYYSDPDL